ncbi:hypothetical protein TSUD_274190 [Trifolium subterraneum]|uniref:RRM domain-containing protein n=1 Tax=Trifolium subterraneum TaxID=3900 RepID=A0A2Z6MWX3_TRISU|nr:hypothetical protein TSUD_274190 [Trifolium subterraneum]
MGDQDDQQWQPVTGRIRKGRGTHHLKSDIATTKRSNREHNNDLTTYFFTNFPASFGAKAMFNAFKYYGDIIEVIIPAKLDKQARRFGFTRFDRVADSRSFEYELDNIIIGRDKLDVNLSLFQCQVGIQGFEVGSVEKHREGGDLR